MLTVKAGSEIELVTNIGKQFPSSDGSSLATVAS